MASDLNTKIGRSLSVKLNRASGCDDKEKDKEKFGQTEEEPNKSSYKSKKDHVLDKMGVGKKEKKRRAISPRGRSQSCKSLDMTDNESSPNEEENFSEASVQEEEKENPLDEFAHQSPHQSPHSPHTPHTPKTKTPRLSPQPVLSERAMGSPLTQPEKHSFHRRPLQGNAELPPPEIQEPLDQVYTVQLPPQTQKTYIQNRTATDAFEDLASLAEMLQTKARVVQERIAIEKRSVEEEKQSWEKEKQEMATRFLIKSNVVELCVGGTNFTTYKSILCKYPESMLAALFSGRHPFHKDRKGRFFIDRDPKTFRYILNFLRRDVMIWPESEAMINEITVDLEFFGLLECATAQPKHFIDSQILGEREDYRHNLIDLLDKFKSVDLLYQATTQDWDVTEFHAKCDNKGPTVTIIQVSSYIFGGYTPLSWDTSGTYKTDNRTFLFSLTNPTKSGTGERLPNSGYNSKESIYCNAQYGPTFGQGHDIYIGENLTNCYTNFLCSFGHPMLPASLYTKPQAKNFFCGSYKFVPRMIEVYSIDLLE